MAALLQRLAYKTNKVEGENGSSRTPVKPEGAKRKLKDQPFPPLSLTLTLMVRAAFATLLVGFILYSMLAIFTRI